MKKIARYFSSSVGKKQLIGLTGLGICGFTLMHMVSNMLILVSRRSYNEYSHMLVTHPLIYYAEAALLGAFLLHIALTIQLAYTNRKARGVGNSQLATNPLKRGSFAVRTMILSGLFMLSFLIIHLATFKYGTVYSIQYNGVVVRDIWRLVVEKFQNPAYTAWYFFCLILLGLHLSHGFAASFQSLGIASVRTPWLKKLGWAFALLVTAGFMSQPIYALVIGAH